MLAYGIFIQNFSGVYLFCITIAFNVATILLNRAQHYNTAKYLMLIAGNLIVFLFLQKDPVETGSYLYLIPCYTAAISFFSFREKNRWLFFVLLTSLLFLINQLEVVQLIEEVSFTDKQKTIYFFINFFASISLNLLMIYFLMRTNNSIEEDLRENQELLKSSEERFRLAVYGVDAGIWDWPKMTESYMWWSPKCYELLGYGYDEIPPHKTSFWNLLIHPDEVDKINEALINHLKRRKPFLEHIRLKTKDYGYRWFLCSGQALWDSNGSPVRMVGSIINMHEHVLREEKMRTQNLLLEKTNKELDRFVYSASHDLRAPLSSILGLINLAMIENDRDEINKMLELMKGRVANLNDFINEIIDYSKNARVEVKSELIDIGRLIDEVIGNVKFRDGLQDIEIVKAVSSGLVVLSDPGRLRVVLNNLLDNAIKYHDKSKTRQYIKISAEQENGSIIIMVEDNGRGIKEEQTRKVFNMFYRASEDSKGSGLGLYIVKETVEKLGGQISIQSTYLEGTTFYLRLARQHFNVKDQVEA